MFGNMEIAEFEKPKRKRERESNQPIRFVALLLIISGSFLFVGIGKASATTRTVTPSGDTTGVTDTSAINTAITASVSGDIVSLSSGTFYVAISGATPFIIPTSNITIQGAAKTLTNIILAASAGFTFNVDFPAIFSENNKTGVTFKDFALDGQRDLVNGTTFLGGYVGIGLTTGSGHTIQDIDIKDMDSHFITSQSSSNLTITRVTTSVTTNTQPSIASHGVDFDATPTGGSATGILVQDSDLDNYWGDAAKVENASTVTFQNTIFRKRLAISQDPVGLCYSALNAISITANTFYDDVVLSGLKNCGGTGNVTLSGNTFANDRAVIFSSDATAANYGTITITNNTFQGLNSYWFAAAITPVVSGNTGVNAQRTLFVHTTADRYQGNPSGLSPYIGESIASTNIAGAISAAATGDRIVVLDGTYMGSGNKNINLDNAKVLTVTSKNGSASTILDCQNEAAKPAFSIGAAAAGSSISGFTIQNCTSNNGGGIYINGVSPSISNMIINSTTAVVNGGGIYTTGSNSVISNVEIMSASAGSQGGGVNFNNSSPTLRRSRIHGNSAVSNGGGLRFGGGTPIVEYSLIYSNTSSAGSGGGLQSGASGAVLNNNVFYGNTSVGAGTEISTYNATTTITNSILWGGATPISKGGAGTLTVSYSGVQGGYTGTGNISTNPLFTSTSASDFTLQSTSPAIDSGVDLDISTDIVGNPPYDMPGVGNTGSVGSYAKNYVDMGAYEYSTPPIPTIESSTHPSESTWYTSISPVTIAFSSPYATTATTTDFRYIINQTASPTAAAVQAGSLLDDLITFNAGGSITSDGTWYVHVIAQNEASTTIFSTNFDSYAIKYDNSSPAVTLSSPANNSGVTSGTPTFTWLGTDTASGISTYDLYIDSALNTSNISSGTAPSSLLSCGSHTWYVKATDGVGFTANSSHTYTFTVPCGAISFYSPPTVMVAPDITSIKLPLSAQTTPMAGPVLSEEQIQAIVSLLNSFGAVDQSVINRVTRLLHGPIVTATSSQSFSFTHNLSLYDTSNDIKALQQFLNTHDFTVASTGPGSPGNETTFLGMRTYAALMRFQRSKGLPATGWFGPMTRGKINAP